MAIIATYMLEDLPNKIQPARTTPMTVSGITWGHRPRGQGMDGYGRKITTDRMVQLPGSKRWRRVYCCIMSNIGTNYVQQGDDWIVIH